MDKVIIMLLLAAGIVVIGRTMGDLAAILHDAVRDGKTSLVRLLLALHPALITTSSGRHRETPLHCAARHGLRDSAWLLLAMGAPVNARDAAARTPLHLAVQRGDRRMGELLIAWGADANTADQSGYYPLHYAAAPGWEDTAKDMVAMLLSRGALLEARDPHGKTALMHAAFSGRDDIARLLVMNGADINAKDAMGMTPLAFAAMSLQLSRKMLELLLQKGADMTAVDGYGATPLDYALHTLYGVEGEKDKKKFDDRQREIIDLLRRYGEKEPEEHLRGPGEGDHW